MGIAFSLWLQCVINERGIAGKQALLRTRILFRLFPVTSQLKLWRHCRDEMVQADSRFDKRVAERACKALAAWSAIVAYSRRHAQKRFYLMVEKASSLPKKLEKIIQVLLGWIKRFTPLLIINDLLLLLAGAMANAAVVVLLLCWWRVLRSESPWMKERMCSIR